MITNIGYLKLESNMIPTRIFIETFEDWEDECYGWSEMDRLEELDRFYEMECQDLLDEYNSFDSKLERAYTNSICFIWRNFLKPFGIK